MNVDIDVSGVTLYTPRLILRPWRPEDLDDFFAYARVDGVGQEEMILYRRDRLSGI